ncbi:PIN/TRAM domain-containing protein [Phosphitispora sp. TUW77]|uniref:PIN/TRAM domain-containing protein n=1 Tax=Phosphitispora sp. TUW77 TaxID=3152361 RepID=UPI003AB636A5
MFRRALKIMVIIFLMSLGFGLSYYYLPGNIGGVDIAKPVMHYGIIGIITFLCGFLGILLASGIIERTVQFTSWLEFRLIKMSIQEVVGGAVGLIIGLIIATLLGAAISWLPLWVGGILRIIVTLLLGYLGLSVGMKRKEELLGFLPRFSKDKQTKTDIKTAQSCKILDTSVIIDGRIADICKSGFIEGTLIIPGFILEELRHIADSSDLLKRNRGRRGLDILNKIRKELDVMVQIYEQDFEEIAEVDSKLVKLAQVLNAKVVTNDYNLNKVAELHGVKVLNINELANAVKPVVLPGEEMLVQVIKDGKEMGQGVAYLDDGTMIVVDGGKKFIGRKTGVVVTSVLQTAAGRMIFARLKSDKKNLDHDPPSSYSEVNFIG